MDPQNLETLILDHIRNDNYHPVKPRVICKQLQLSPDDRHLVRRAVKNLIRRYCVNRLMELLFETV